MRSLPRPLAPSGAPPWQRVWSTRFKSVLLERHCHRRCLRRSIPCGRKPCPMASPVTWRAASMLMIRQSWRGTLFGLWATKTLLWCALSTASGCVDRDRRPRNWRWSGALRRRLLNWLRPHLLLMMVAKPVLFALQQQQLKEHLQQVCHSVARTFPLGRGCLAGYTVCRLVLFVACPTRHPSPLWEP